jgi:hypothetical protein
MTSITFSVIDCTATRSDGDAQYAFTGIALLPLIFFATASGAIVGALRLFRKSMRLESKTLSQ